MQGGAASGNADKTALLEPGFGRGAPDSAMGRPTPDGQRRRVVVGGAASVATESMTQTYDIKVLTEAKVTPPGPGRPQPAAGAQATRLVVSAGANPIAAGHAEAELSHRRSSSLPLVIGLLVILLCAAVVLSMFGVLPNPGFLPYLGNSRPPAEQTGPAQPAANQPQANVLLGRVRSMVVPPFVSAGDTPTGLGLAVASIPDPSGVQRQWISRPSQPQPVELDGSWAESITETDMPVYLLFDSHTDTPTVVRTSMDCAHAQLTAYVVGLDGRQ
jgi:hypothetical protein